jgi:hypothetical protein
MPQMPNKTNGAVETPVAAVFDAYRPMLQGMAACSNVLCDGYAAMSSEWLAFVNRRMQSDLSLPSKLSACANPQDLLQEWAGFMNSAADDYRKEFARLSAIGTATSQRAAVALGTPDNAERRTASE